MASSKNYRPNVCLNNFWQFSGSSPLAFNNIDLGCIPCDDSACSKVWEQYTYSGQLNIEGLAECLCVAEQDITDVLGTSLFETSFCDTLDIPANWFNNQRPGRSLSTMTFTTKHTQVISFGQLTDDLIVIDAPIIYIDADEDGFFETANATFTVPEGVELCELHYQHTEYDLEICPVTVESFDEVTRIVTVRIDTWNLVDPSLYINHTFAPNQRSYDGCDITNFVETLAVFRRYRNTCLPDGYIRYREHVCNGVCTLTDVPFCAILTNPCTGEFQITLGTLDEDGCFTTGGCPPLCACPVNMQIFYQAGLCKRCDGNCKNGDCNCKRFENMVFTLASACLPSYDLCNCACVFPRLQHLQTETGIVLKSEGKSYNFPFTHRSNNPFGTTIAAIDTWLAVQRLLNDSSLCFNYY